MEFRPNRRGRIRLARVNNEREMFKLGSLAHTRTASSAGTTSVRATGLGKFLWKKAVVDAGVSKDGCTTVCNPAAKSGMHLTSADLIVRMRGSCAACKSRMGFNNNGAVHSNVKRSMGAYDGSKSLSLMVAGTLVMSSAKVMGTSVNVGSNGVTKVNGTKGPSVVSNIAPKVAINTSARTLTKRKVVMATNKVSARVRFVDPRRVSYTLCDNMAAVVNNNANPTSNAGTAAYAPKP